MLSIFSKRFLSSLLFILLLITAQNCGTESNEPEISHEYEIELISVHDLNIENPSGLTIDVSGDALWTVSDRPGGRIYKISFDGYILDRLPYEGDDMEGITMDPQTETLWVAEERMRTILQFETDGTLLREVPVPVAETNINDGLEGIAIHPETGHLFILNEKHPRVFIELDADMERVREVGINFEEPYVMTDLSGLFYEPTHDHFWIVSDESKRIVITDFDLNPVHHIELDRRKFEGIAVDLANNRLYLVNDEEDRLYVFRLVS